MWRNRLFVTLSPFRGCLFCLLCYFVVLLRCVWGVSGVFIGDATYCITVYCVVVGVLVGILPRNTYVPGAGFSVRETHTNSPYFVQSTPER